MVVKTGSVVNSEKQGKFLEVTGMPEEGVEPTLTVK
jgi:hypothetical protein